MSTGSSYLVFRVNPRAEDYLTDLAHSWGCTRTAAIARIVEGYFEGRDTLPSYYTSKRIPPRAKRGRRKPVHQAAPPPRPTPDLSKSVREYLQGFTLHRPRYVRGGRTRTSIHCSTDARKAWDAMAARFDLKLVEVVEAALLLLYALTEEG